MICDETHRVEKPKDKNDRIKSIIEHSYISVFFYDKKQSVSLDDYVTNKKIIGQIIRQIINNKKSEQFNEQFKIKRKKSVLTYQHRIMNDTNYLTNDAGYLDLINRILYPGKRTTNNGINNSIADKQKNGYEVKLVEKPETLKSIIIRRNSVNGQKELKGMVRPSRMLAGKGSTEVKVNSKSKLISKRIDWYWNFGQMTTPTIGPLGDVGCPIPAQEVYS